MQQFRAWSLPGVAAALLLAAGATDEPAPVMREPLFVRIAAEAFSGPVSAHVERVVDGDTIDVQARIWLGQTLEVRIRIDGIDAPELEARCAAERLQALAARDFLERRLAGGEVLLSRVVYDKYGGRVRASVSDSRGDIADAMLKSGLARSYHGGARQPWCAD